MSEVAGWNVWAISEGITRKFTVAYVSESEALTKVRNIGKGVAPVSREPLTNEALAEIEIPTMGLIEWAPIGRHSKVTLGGTLLKSKISI